MSRVIAIVACGLSVAACSASMPSLDFLKSSPQTEALAIESEPPGAEAKASTGQSCRTPCQLTVQPDGELSVTLALNGYQPQTVSIREAEGSSKLAPNPVFVELQPGAAPSARKPAAKKKPATAAVRKPSPSATASAAPPSAAPPSATASAASPPTPAAAAAPAPAASAEPAASATNYPWPSR
jgi:PEGA domain